MNRLALPVALAGAALLGPGCAQPQPAVGQPQAPSAVAPAECNGPAAQFALGRPWTAALAEEVRTRSRADRVRVVRPGQMVTMEFDARRLTVQLDAQDRVVSARCG